MEIDELENQLVQQAINRGQDPAEVRAKLRELALLRRKKELLEQNQILNYRPNPAQHEMTRVMLADTPPRVRIWFGGNRGGKSWWLSTESCAYALGRRLWLPEDDPLYLTPFRPPTYVRIASTPQELRETISPYIRQIIPANMLDRTRKSQDGVEMYFYLKNGSTITLYSYEMDYMAYEGARAHFWGFNEPPKRRQWIGAWRGLTDYGGHAAFAMTPLAEPWIQRDLVARAKQGDPNVFFNQYSTYINVGFGLNKESVDQFASTLTDAEKKTRIDGAALHLQGLVVDQYQPDIHIVKFDDEGVLGNDYIKFPRSWFPDKQWPSDWCVYTALDPHPRKPHAFLVVGVDPEGTIHVFRERWFKPVDADQLAEELKKTTDGLRCIVNLIDPLAKQADLTKASRTLMSSLIAAGWSCITGTKDRASGIYNINDVMRPVIEENRPVPKIVFWDDGAYPVKRMLTEFDNWVWKDAEETDEEAMNIKAAEEWDDQCSNLYRILAKKPVHVPRKIIDGTIDFQPYF